MIAAWMLYSIATGMLIGVAALAGEHCCRALRLPVRWVWVGGLLATVALSGVALVRIASAADAESRVEPLAGYVFEASSAAEPKASGVGTAILQLGRDARARIIAATAGVYRAVATAAGAGRGVAFIWLLSSSALLLLLGLTLLRARRARAHWQTDQIGDVRVLVSENDGPAVVGLLHPAIVVPAWLLAESIERQRLVVQHEHEHRRAWDHALLTLACVAVCLMPWNVALWFMLKRTRLAVELDCDARVLRNGAAPQSYGSLLLEIAGRARSRPFAAPALADTRSHLERRLLAMTEKNRTAGWTRAAAAGASALLLSAAACTTELPTAATIDALDVAEMEEQVEASRLLPLAEDAGPLFIIDGVVATREEAHAIAAEDIESIEVLKGSAAVSTYGERAAGGVVYVAKQVGGEPTLIISEEPNAVPLETAQGGVVRLRATRAAAADARASQAAGTAVASLRRTDEVRSVLEARAATAVVTPVIMVDGVVQDSFDVRSLSPEAIERIEVVKGAAALRESSDPRAANGIIRITTKKKGSQ